MRTIGSFSKPEEAHLVRSRLEAAGIPAFVRDDLTVQLNWLYSNALGGVRVEVPEDCADAARELIWSESDNAPEAAAVECPRCGSSAVNPIEWPRRVAYLSVLLLMFPIPSSAKRQRCGNCGWRWR